MQKIIIKVNDYYTWLKGECWMMMMMKSLPLDWNSKCFSFYWLLYNWLKNKILFHLIWRIFIHWREWVKKIFIQLFNWSKSLFTFRCALLSEGKKKKNHLTSESFLTFIRLKREKKKKNKRRKQFNLNCFLLHLNRIRL